MDSVFRFLFCASHACCYEKQPVENSPLRGALGNLATLQLAGFNAVRLCRTSLRESFSSDLSELCAS